MLKTMAMKITRENWSVAAAIMPNWFILRPMQEVLDTYIVINEMGVLNAHTNALEHQPLLTYTHTTYEADEFFKAYNMVRSEMPNQFNEVEPTGEVS